MSIRTEIELLERQVADLGQAIDVARNENTGRIPQLVERVHEIEERIDALRPFAEPLPVKAGSMPACSGCGRPFWPESLTDGRCDSCGPLGGEGPSESIQTGDLKRRRAPKS
jgi:hypothetical protein